VVPKAVESDRNNTRWELPEFTVGAAATICWLRGSDSILPVYLEERKTIGCLRGFLVLRCAGRWQDRFTTRVVKGIPITVHRVHRMLDVKPS
jgi:hypothetical protein